MSELSQSDPEAWPPITIARQASGKFRGIDGYARCTVAAILGLSEIRATVEGVPGDVRSRAFELNQHGWPLTILERKNHARYLKQHYPTLSDREVARKCGLSPTTVATTVQNGQGNEQKSSDPRIELAKAAVRFLRGYSKLQGLIDETFTINPNRPKSVAAVLREFSDGDLAWLATTKKACLDIAAFLRGVAGELK